MGKIINVFNFLIDFNEISNPVITEIGNQKWHLYVSDIPEIDEIRSVFLGHEMGEIDYLEIKRTTLLPCPNPHNTLLEWLKNDWNKLGLENVEVEEKLLRESLNSNGELVYYDEYFYDDQSRVNAYELWIAARNFWRITEVPKSKGLDLYNKLFQLYSEMKLESESVELVIGDGNIRWYTKERVIDHPVLLQKVNMHFDAHVPSFTIYCDEKKSELYTPMLRVISSINQKMLSDIIVEIDEGDYDLAQTENTAALFKRIINVIDINGTFIEQPKAMSQTATIYSTPVVFLRRRTLGFSSFINRIIDDVQENTEATLPEFYDIMAGNFTGNQQEEIVEKSWNYNGIDQDVLLTLPANNEQLRIIKYLDKYGAVLVQGPPGTGKTHSIANLIGHLLSEGNSVLVTSHTEKALTVLKEKVYHDPYDHDINLQTLCISLLSSTSQKKEMDEAIDEIASKSSSIDLHYSFEKTKRLEKERKELVNQLKQLTEELVRARSMEYKDLIFDNHSMKPIDAAKFLSNCKNRCDYITGKSNNDEVCFPLTHEELVFLYQSNELVDIEEENLLRNVYPSVGQIISSSDFTSMVNRINELQKNHTDTSSFKEAEILVPIETIIRIMDEADRLISRLNGFEPLERNIVNMTMADRYYPQLWDIVICKIEGIQFKYDSYRRLKLVDDFCIKGLEFNKQSLQIVQQIIDLGKDRPVGIFAKGEWKKIRDSVKVNGRPVETRDEFIKVYELISYEVEKLEIIKQLNKLLAEVIDFELFTSEDFENKINKYMDRILNALSWYHKECATYFLNVHESVRWGIENKFPSVISIDNLNTALSFLHLTKELFQAKINEDELQKIHIKIKEYKIHLSGFVNENPIIEALVESVEALDKDLYINRLKALNALMDKNDTVKKRVQLISQIRTIAPMLAMQLERREGIHSHKNTPEYFDDAWKYFQLKNQIERLDALNPDQIQINIEKVNKLLLKNARKLAFEKAWYNKIKGQTAKQNQALQGWRNTIKQIGKDKGKNAPMLKAKARELMPLCQTAIPVWIMPLNRVVENFDPRKNKFDVIIIDEASQANILAISALYLAKKVIIVGDDEQVSPDSFGIKTEEIKALIDQHLEGIPNNHLYNGLTSLYDVAKSSGFKPLMLTEHFRCLPEIIGFSNHLSYNNRIKPLRDSSNVPVYPAVVEYRVPGATRNNNKVNEAEVEHIVSLIQAFLEIEEYKGQTIGVISMLGNEQSAAIEKKLQSVIDPVEYEERRIQCGTPPQFQGDERDIVLLSLVDSPNENGGPLRLLSEDGNNDKYRKRYNVAVSRARNQLWVVHSLNPEIDLKPDDLRLKLIKYAMNPNLDQENLISKSESPFEMEVMKYLLAENYKIIPQYKVGAYRIDMVIQYHDKKVALECDGEKFHDEDQLKDDLARQAILERLGWRFIRIRGSTYYLNPGHTMKCVVEMLSKYEIYPTYEDMEPVHQENEALINLVKNKAYNFRNGLKDQINLNELPELKHLKNDTNSSDRINDKTNVNTTTVDQHKYKDEKAIGHAVNINIETGKCIEQLKLSSLNGNKNKPVRTASEPLFDFRGNPNIVRKNKERKETVKEAPAVKGILDKPKFDSTAITKF